MPAMGSIAQGAATLVGARHLRSETSHRVARVRSAWGVLLALFVAMVFALVVTNGSGAAAIGTAVPLGSADSYAVLAGQTVTNTGPSVVTGDLGLSPGSAVVGFPPGIVLGSIHAADAEALQAQSDLVIAYNNAAGQAPDAALPPELGGLTLVPGVYNAPVSIGLTGTLTLDAQGNADAVWIFQIGSELTTATASQVSLINGAQPCNVVWQVGSSATLGTDSDFVGNLLALASISANTGADVIGRLLARNGSVTLDTNDITRALCAGATTTTSAGGGATTIAGGGATTIAGGTTPTTLVAPTFTGPSTIVPDLTLPETGGQANGNTVWIAGVLLALGIALASMARRRHA